MSDVRSKTTGGMSRTKRRIIENLGAASFGQVVNVLVRVVSIPVLLRCWGKELCGEWLMLSTIPAYFAMNDLGFAGAGATEMTIQVAGNDRKAARSVFQSIWILTSCLSLIAGAGLILILYHVPVASWMKLTLIGERQLLIVTSLFLCQVLVIQQMGILQAGFRCEGNYAYGSVWAVLLELAEFLTLIVTVMLGGGPIRAAGTVLVMRIIGYLIIRQRLRRLSPWLELGFRDANKKNIYALAGPAIAHMAFPMGRAIGNQGMVSSVGIMLGPVAVVMFTTVRTLANAAFQILGIIHRSIWPELSVAFGAGNIAQARNLHRKACHAAFWFALAGASCLLIAGPFIYRIWMPEMGNIDFALLTALLTVVVANSIWHTSSSVPMALNRHQRIAVWYVLGALLSIVLAIVLIRYLGLAGAGWALLVLDGVMIIKVLPYSIHLVEDNLWKFVLSVFSPAGCMQMLQESWRWMSEFARRRRSTTIPKVIRDPQGSAAMPHSSAGLG